MVSRTVVGPVQNTMEQYLASQLTAAVHALVPQLTAVLKGEGFDVSEELLRSALDRAASLTGPTGSGGMAPNGVLPVMADVVVPTTNSVTTSRAAKAPARKKSAGEKQRPRCAGTTLKGDQCGRIAKEGYQYCAQHLRKMNEQAAPKSTVTLGVKIAQDASGFLKNPPTQASSHPISLAPPPAGEFMGGPISQPPIEDDELDGGKELD